MLFSSFLALVLSQGALNAAEAPASVGVVNFTTCVTDSKLGKQEQASFESLKKQMGAMLEDTEKQMKEISEKLSDKEFLDGLSPEGEEQLKTKFHMLSEDMNKYQNQYYQVLNQANMRLIQVMSQSIASASEKVSKDKKLAVIVNKEACFFYSPQLDVTDQIIAQLDREFESEGKKQAAVTPPASAQATSETKKK